MREFERAPGGCICNVLAVLSDGEESMRATFDAAIELAEATNARLTLVKTCEQGRAYVWVAPFAVGAAYMPAELESPEEASQLLSRLVAEVPDSIPVTTLVLGSDSQSCLIKLLRERYFGALVADKDQLARWRQVRRQLRREQLHTVLIKGGCRAQSAGTIPVRFSSDGLNKDGAVDDVQVLQGRSRRRGGLWPWHARGLAGAGGEH